MPANPILVRMLDRLFASLVKGPSLNCRPHNSRQRVDLTHLSRFKDIEPEQVLVQLLGDRGEVTVTGKVPTPADLHGGFHKDRFSTDEDDEQQRREETPEYRDWRMQKALLNKIRNLSDDARTYEQDTGVNALNIGYPLLSLPPGTLGGGTQRILAPIAFIPVSLLTRAGQKSGVDISRKGEGVDLIMPNAALMAWLERQTGKAAADLFNDEEGQQPWREMRELIEHIAKLLELKTPGLAEMTDPLTLRLEPAPKAESLNAAATILPCAIVGLFPLANQGLLHDTKQMIDEDSLNGPVKSFIEAGISLDQPASTDTDEPKPVEKQQRRFVDERLVTLADPFQSQAVAQARTCSGLVIHGPPGTGKSQTITNIIGDHLARGERVLFVCDKRTALDVVANRLEHLGLGGLCALVHDAQRDQRDLYLAIRARLEQLPEIKTAPRAEKKLEKIDEQLQLLHGELTQCHNELMLASADGPALHDLMGQWLTIDAPVPGEAHTLDSITPDQLDQHRQDIEVALRRGRSAAYHENAWERCVGTTLEAFLRRQMPELRRALASCVENARAADTAHHPSVPAFNLRQSLAEQARAREELAGKLQHVIDKIKPDIAARCVNFAAEQMRQYLDRLNEAELHLAVLRRGPLNTELQLTARDLKPTPAKIAQQLRTLDDYLAIAKCWYRFVYFGLNSQAGKVLGEYGLPRDADAAQQLRDFLHGLRARIVLGEIHQILTEAAPPSLLWPDVELEQSITQHRDTLELLTAVSGDESLDQPTRSALADINAARSLLDGLTRSRQRAEALEAFEKSLAQIDLFDAGWLTKVAQQVRQGRKVADVLVRLEQQFDTLESVLRIGDTLKKLPKPLREAVVVSLRDAVEPDTAMAGMVKGVLAGEIARRIASSPTLQQLDDQRIASSFERYRALENEKRDVVRNVIIHHWISQQKQRLLVGTGTRLNSEGAKLRQRLFVRGKRALRLRQVIALGQDTDGGDPLFDLCPVWMASPETVAQIFPRQIQFDVVIFDEASQCKLEQALPVLTRARRVVVAGDPKQLPPTRFFEAAVTGSDDEQLESDQDLFEAQQSEVEDLLNASLNLQIEESFLNVHYRSRNADLIEFSNQQFYQSRLQAIPGHPSNRTQFPPLTLHRTDGIYEDRTNAGEAEKVCQIVHDLLRRADPPSIGIACFNLAQRDLIAEMLDEKAAGNDDFAARLAKARERRGEGSFEGLFVKNLENVQGDERDHIIISTTYGPTREGRFFRRFGPLGNAGGGRRLNVLVTRARHEVHLVTSIPREVYLAQEPIPDGQNPSGGWLLLAYLRFAEQLANAYEENHRILSAEKADGPSVVHLREIPVFSRFAHGLGRELARTHRITSDVHWGNAGFRVDASLHHPHRLEDVTVGVLCDFTCFEGARDPVEWDIFRTAMHEYQGWKLHRIWSPQYFRDDQRCLNSIARDVQIMLDEEAKSRKSEADESA